MRYSRLPLPRSEAALPRDPRRKPLVLVRALILGLFLPATDAPQRDREIFLRLMTMDDEGMCRRCKGLSAREASLHLTYSERAEASVERDNGQIAWNRDISSARRKSYEKRAFLRMNYDERLTHCLRPEEIDGPDAAAWKGINAHLGTSATSLPEFVRELGAQRFGHVSRVGDAFAGGGSIPCMAFFDVRQTMVRLLRYLATRPSGERMPHWKKDVEAWPPVWRTKTRPLALSWRVALVYRRL